MKTNKQTNKQQFSIINDIKFRITFEKEKHM